MSARRLLAESFATLPALIAAVAAERPAAVALVHGERSLSYGELDRFADRVAGALQRDGTGPGDAVAICAATSIEYLAAFVGALRAGAAATPLPVSATAATLARMTADAGVRVLIADATVSGLAAALAPAWQGRCVALGGGAGAVPFDAWLAAAPATPRPVDIQPDWTFNILYSSGTTGTPKGIVQPHRMRWQHIQRVDYGDDAVTLISTPLYSNTTLVAVIPTLARGGTVLLMDRFDVARYLELAERHRATHTMLVPAQVRRLMAHPGFDACDLASFRMKFVTSAPFPAALKADVLARWPGGLTEFYDLTEGGGVCVLAAHERPDKLHTVGRPAPGSEFRVIDAAGRELPDGATGELVGRSAAMMSGYHGRPQASAEAEWYDAGGTRFIRTGDVGRFDAEGFLTLLDRRKDVIISGGFNVYPADLEAVLEAHPAVAEAAVVGVASERWGETPLAVVVLKPEGATEAEELRAWANERLGATQRLAAVALASSLPRSAIGKVLKRELRDQYAGRGPQR
jgi:acyl-CoA synthetase (AMP-forming)/AMP-acid ligase II